MKKNELPTPLLDEYMESVKGMQEAATAPFFYTRLYATMQKQPDWVFPLKPAWIITGLALLLLLNGFMTVNKFSTSSQHTTAATPSLQSFASVYDLTIQSAY